MDRRIRAAPRAEERLHRFLRPGALARLRDSRIVARSLRSAAAAACHLPLSVPSPPATPRPISAAAMAEQQGRVPQFLWGHTRGLGSGARYPLRRRMAAARAVVFLPPPSPEAFYDAFTPPSDLVTAR